MVPVRHFQTEKLELRSGDIEEISFDSGCGPVHRPAISFEMSVIGDIQIPGPELSTGCGIERDTEFAEPVAVWRLS